MYGVYMLLRFAVFIVIYFTLSKIAWSLHVFTDVAEFYSTTKNRWFTPVN